MSLTLIASLTHRDAEVCIHIHTRAGFDIDGEIDGLGGGFRVSDAAVAAALVLCDGWTSTAFMFVRGLRICDVDREATCLYTHR